MGAEKKTSREEIKAHREGMKAMMEVVRKDRGQIEVGSQAGEQSIKDRKRKGHAREPATGRWVPRLTENTDPRRC
jgi:hypothetical protein